MDRIVFPYRGYPPYPPREIIYPKNKSALELLLDHFMMEERRGENIKNLLHELENNKIPYTRWETPDNNYYRKYFRGRNLEFHASWTDTTLQKWADTRVEHLNDIPQREIRLQVDPAWPLEETRRRIAVAVGGAIRMHPRLRQGLVMWRFGEQALGPASGSGNIALEHALSWLWDGMRRLPYTDGQVATAIGTCVELYRRGVPGSSSTADREIADHAFGASLRVEFGGPDGSYARAYAGREALLGAMRDDLAEIVANEHRDILGEPKRIFQVIFSPQRLFDFDRLCAVFAEQILPWQVLSETGWVAFFSPSRLDAFGLP
jgi:hypothetical protein